MPYEHLEICRSVTSLVHSLCFLLAVPLVTLLLQPIIDAVFSPDGTAVATASLDGDVKFFQFDVSGDVMPK